MGEFGKDEFNEAKKQTLRTNMLNLLQKRRKEVEFEKWNSEEQEGHEEEKEGARDDEFVMGDVNDAKKSQLKKLMLNLFKQKENEKKSTVIDTSVEVGEGNT